MIELHFIGTSDAFGAGGRRQSAFLARDPHGSILVDCGVTTNTGLCAEGLHRDEIDAILISHFHADHFGGIPLLLLAALYEDRRTRPIEIAGPPGIETRVTELAEAMGHSITRRDWTFPIVFTELPAGLEVSVGPANITSFETHHNPDACPHGLKIGFDKARLVYSGDTGWFDDLPSHVQGADLFICECTYCHTGWEYHLSLEQLDQMKSSFDCERMILTHLGSEMSRRRSDLALETADDGLEIKI